MPLPHHCCRVGLQNNIFTGLGLGSHFNWLFGPWLVNSVLEQSSFRQMSFYTRGRFYVWVYYWCPKPNARKKPINIDWFGNIGKSWLLSGAKEEIVWGCCRVTKSTDGRGRGGWIDGWTKCQTLTWDTAVHFPFHTHTQGLS